MGNDLTASCRAIFRGTENRSDLADHIEKMQPRAACEAVTVDEASPSPVADGETIYRILISPVDFAEDGGVLERPFQKVYGNGVSVMRSIASTEDIEAIMIDRLEGAKQEEGRQIRAVYGAAVSSSGGVRSLHDGEGERLFGIYDQLVSRKSGGDKVRTHAGVFLRRPPKGAIGRKRLQKDYAGRLRAAFMAGKIELESFYGGIALTVNARFADETKN